MKQRTGNGTIQAIPTPDLLLSKYPTHPLDVRIDTKCLPELPVELATFGLCRHNDPQLSDIAFSKKEHLPIILALLNQDSSPPDYKKAWGEFLLCQSFTHFCTLTFSRDLAKNRALANKMVLELFNQINRFLLGRNFAKPSKREQSPLIIAFSDIGSDQKTRKKFQRIGKSSSLERHIRFGNNHALHFHLLIRLNPEHLSTIEKKGINLQELISSGWLSIGKIFASPNDGTENAFNYCDNSLITPIENQLATILYCLKDFQQFPSVGAASPSDPPTRHIMWGHHFLMASPLKTTALLNESKTPASAVLDEKSGYDEVVEILRRTDRVCQSASRKWHAGGGGLSAARRGRANLLRRLEKEIRASGRERAPPAAAGGRGE